MDEMVTHFEDMEMDARVEDVGLEVAGVVADHAEAVLRDLQTAQGRALLAMLAGPLPAVERY